MPGVTFWNNPLKREEENARIKTDRHIRRISTLRVPRAP